VCSIAVDQLLVISKVDVTTYIKITNNSSASVSVSGESSKSADFQVSPNQAQTIAVSGSASFGIKAKKSGVYSATFTSSCGDKKVVAVTILLL